MTKKYQRSAVRCIETGEVFISAAEAAHHLNMTRAAVSAHLSGKAPSVAGLHFERVKIPARPVQQKVAELQVIINRALRYAKENSLEELKGILTCTK